MGCSFGQAVCRDGDPLTRHETRWTHRTEEHEPEIASSNETIDRMLEYQIPEGKLRMSGNALKDLRYSATLELERLSP